MQRLRDALRRRVPDSTANRQYRPNELRLDAVRAERLRREGQRVEPSPSPPRPSSEEQQPRRDPGLAKHSTPARAVPRHVTALKTRSGLRQAWLLKEILAPPMALRDPLDGDNDR